jgi:hypothetical protein
MQVCEYCTDDCEICFGLLMSCYSTFAQFAMVTVAHFVDAPCLTWFRLSTDVCQSSAINYPFYLPLSSYPQESQNERGP